MDFAKLELFAAMRERMDYLSERQTLIAQNIANANTPGYQARDLRPVDFADLVARRYRNLKLEQTSPMHIGAPPPETDFQTLNKRKGFETTIMGNNVVLEEEMKKMSDVNMDYQSTTNLYRKTMDMFRLAGGGR